MEAIGPGATTIGGVPDLHTPTLTYDPSPRAPALALPAGACDAHVHVFGPAARFPYAAGRNFTPVDAPKEALFALHRTLGIGRCVIVQSAVHGFDNRVVEDAIAAGGGRYLGVALAPVDVADAELARLAAAGIRGVRFNFMKHLPGTPVDAIVDFTRRLAPLGMHLQVHFDSSLVHGLGPALARSAVPVVIDHMGRVDARLGADHADFAALFALMKNPLFRVKVSGIDRIDATPEPAPTYAHGIALARRLVEAYPQRCLWGTDWPHPNHTHVPADAVLVEALAAIAPTADLREQLLVANPRDFYRFDA
ncbi:amidohydrolase family protein [Ramlibacter sp. MAHUQ-53]|uniref:amidohydrolase family protein n=1 Tax=unclassified Ramlibacter TaxID=2617605 RepID=UPI0036366C9B